MYIETRRYLSELDRYRALFPDWNALAGSSILLTGGTGLIGTFLADMIVRHDDVANAGITLYVMGRNRDEASRRFNHSFDGGSFRFIEADMALPVKDLPKCDYIVHAGGNAHPAAFISNPVETMRSNVLGTDGLLEHAVKTGVKSFLYVSSGEIYGKASGVDSFTEDYSGSVDITDPRSCYPSSKRAAETLCASYSLQYGLRTVIVRPCHVYGPTFTRSDNRIASRFLQDALEGRDIVLKSDGSQIRSLCYVGDCAIGMLWALIRGATGNAYNIASSDAPVSIRTFAETVANTCGVRLVMDVATNAERSAFNRVERAVLDPSKLEALGWRSVTTLPEGIDRVISILRSEK